MWGIPASRTPVAKAILWSRILYPGFRGLGKTSCAARYRGRCESTSYRVSVIRMYLLPCSVFTSYTTIVRLVRSIGGHFRLKISPVLSWGSPGTGGDLVAGDSSSSYDLLGPQIRVLFDLLGRRTSRMLPGFRRSGCDLSRPVDRPGGCSVIPRPGLASPSRKMVLSPPLSLERARERGRMELKIRSSTLLTHSSPYRKDPRQTCKPWGASGAKRGSLRPSSIRTSVPFMKLVRWMASASP